MMDSQKKKAPSKMRRQNGFTIVEILIMTTILAIVSAFGIIGITNARASVRLSGAAREYASYIEKARMHSIRNHADNDAERASVAINDSKTSYNVTMDLDSNGTLDTKTVELPSDVSFETVETIAFDWRGRTVSIVDEITTTNAQVSITLKNGSNSVSVDVTGSGDITVDSKVFDDSVPNVNLRVGDLASGSTSSSTTPSVGETPSSTPPVLDGTLPSESPSPVGDVPATEPDLGGGTPTPTPTPTPSPSPSPSPSRSPSPSPSPSPVAPCTITTDPANVLMVLGSTKTIKVSHDSSSPITVTASSSKPSDLQVTPGNLPSITAGGAGTFTLKSKSTLGVYNVTFTSGCGSKTVSVVVLLSLL